ncbi:MAG: CheR family methyltransferase [Acidobacteriota bacterium]
MASATLDRVTGRKVLAEDSVRQVLELLNRRFGFQFRDSFLEMARDRLARRMLDLGLENLRDYYYRLLYDPESDREFDRLFDTLSNNETYFFREETQIATFAEEILPERSGAAKSRVRVWSAGCSTGEEPYSLAMAVLEQVGTGADRVEIFGSDYSGRALDRARRGIYHGFSFRNLPDKFRDRYFRREDGGDFRIIPEVRRMVHFGKCNLLGQSGDLPLIKFDAIFCRNVLMYFDRDSRRRVIELFHDRLAEGGYLFLGHSESLLDLSDQFELANLVNDVAYRR